MGSIDDTRKIVQDFIAPDLKAMTVRLELLEKEMHAEFVRADKVSLERFASADKINQERLVALQKSMNAQFEVLTANMAANHASIMSTWEMEKRLTRLESERKAEPQHA